MILRKDSRQAMLLCRATLVVYYYAAAIYDAACLYFAPLAGGIITYRYSLCACRCQHAHFGRRKLDAY